MHRANKNFSSYVMSLASLGFSFWLLLTNAQTAQASVLSDLAASMAPGTFSELTGMNNWNNGNIMVPCGTGIANSITQYANKAVWNPVARRFQFVGSPHDGVGCAGTNIRGVYYAEASNTWGILPTPLSSSNQPQHSYDHNTINPSTGEHFYKQYNSKGFQKLNSGASSWTNLAANPVSNTQCCTSLAWFPDYQGGRVIWVDGDWGVWSWTPGNPGSWTQLAQGNGSDGSGKPSLTMDAYSVFAHYSPLCQCVVFGAGSGLYKLNSDGTFTTLTLAGGPPSPKVGPNGTSIVTEPVTGKLIFISQTTMYEFNPQGVGSWRIISSTPRPSFFNTAGSVSESLISAPISNYGIIMYVKCDDASTCRAYLYKHASGTGTPPPPATPTVSISASPSSVTSGGNSTLTWNSTNATSCSASGGWTGTKSISGSESTGALTVNATYIITCTGTGGSANQSTTVVVTLSSPPPSGSLDFQARCTVSGVLKCVGFDALADLAGTYGDNHGTLEGNSAPSLDSTVKASGNSSIKFAIPSNSGANAAGSYFTNFSDNLSTQFGSNSEVYIQWRQRFSPEFLSTVYQGGGGWKQAIIGTGDKPGCSSSSSTTSSGLCYSSCSALETVTQNTAHRGFAQMYNSCTGSTSHGPYSPFEQPFGSFDFKLQNARSAPYCLYSQSGSNHFPPNGNCFGYFPNEWMTFQVHIKTGPRVNDEFANSFVQLWIAREGQPSELVFDWGPYNLSAGSAGENQRFGKIWLLPYNTGKSSSQSHPIAYTWYDELIISTTKIPDPSATLPSGQPPAAPTALILQ